MLRTAWERLSATVTSAGHRIHVAALNWNRSSMQTHRATPGSTLQRFFARQSVAGLEYAVLLCLVLTAILAESGLLGGVLSQLP